MQLIVKIQRLLGKRQGGETRVTLSEWVNTGFLFPRIGSATVTFSNRHLRLN
jgi:hypothetical protein